MNLAIIDDSSLIRDQLLRLVSFQPGIKVVGTAGAETRAVDLILETRPDIVILDLALTPGSGLNVLERIRAAGCAARVLVLTNHHGDAFRAACEAHTIDGFYDKSTQVQDCLDHMFSWLPNIPVADPPAVAMSPAAIDPTDYDALFDAIPDALFVVGADGRVLHANRAAVGCYGYRQEELAKMHVSDLASPPLSDEMLDHALRTLRAGEAFEWNHRCRDGRELPVEIYSTPIMFKGETALLSCARDISRRRNAEAHLDQHTHLLKKVLDTEPGTVYVYDLEQRRNVYINRHWLHAFGYTPEETEALGPDVIATLFHPDDLPRIVASHEAMRDAADGHLSEIEYRCRTKAGDWRWLQSRETPFLRGRDGRVRQMLGIALDITERRRIEERLRQMSRAFDQCIESIVVTGIDARIEYVNDAFVSISGYSREELIGQNPRVLSCGKTPRERYVALWDALTHGHSWRGEFHNRRKDGSEYFEAVSISPIRAPDGKITHYVAVKEDITEKKRIAAELEAHRQTLEELVRQRTVELVAARETAESANRAKSAFLATMSHEIRTPLNAVIGLTHLVRRGGVSTQQSDQLDRIDVAGQHLLTLIDSVLDLSKIESGALQLENIDFNLHALIDNVTSIVGRLAQDKDLQLRIELDPTLPAWLRGDPTRLRQALLNLTANAVKFTDEGSVTIVARRIGHAGERTHLRFEVVDTGPGIEASALQQLFQPFVQANGSTTRNYGGSGLGLAITRRLAQCMGGDTGVDSRTGQGSRFWFSAWLAQGRATTHHELTDHLDPRAESILRARFGGRRILVVDDEPVNREVAVILLEDAGLKVDAAASGDEAVELARMNDYTAILMDIQMQPVDGLAATRLIRGLPGREHIPIVAVTANAFVEDRERSFDAGMDAFVTKPFRPEELYAVLLRAIDRPKPTVAA